MINRRTFLGTVGAGALGLAGATWLTGCGRTQAARSSTVKPNFVFILIDDMGWRDLACYGSTFYETPHIDRLAAQGMRFTDAYAACPVCSPTRASILTGKYPARLNLTDWIPGHKRPFARLRVPEFNQELPLAEVTIAEALKPAGYVSASIGKWHLGTKPFWPEKQGFDVNFGGTHQGQPPSYFAPYKIPNISKAADGEYLTDRLADEAAAFIEKNRDRPFFLYLAHYAVHTPLMARQEVIAKYAAKAKPDQPQRNAKYAAMVQSVDDSVGRIMAKLDALGLADRTVVFFMSDNGGLIGPTSNLPLRAGKGSLYEGGIREPMIVRWPGVVAAGVAEKAVVTSVDFFPTILALAGVAPAAPDPSIDGASLVPLLAPQGELAPVPVYWHYPHYHPGGATPGGVIRDGDYKLIEFFEDGRVELYNLKEDLGEKKDLAAAMPEKAAQLRRKLADWRRKTGARMPTPNPDYDPQKEPKRADKRSPPPLADAGPLFEE